MANKPPKKCSAPGCHNSTLKRLCAKCTSIKTPDKLWYCSTEWRAIREAHLAEFPFCQCTRAECNHGELGCLSPERKEVDHIKPISQGGSRRSRANLQTLCRSCHSRKTMAEMRARGLA